MFWRRFSKKIAALRRSYASGVLRARRVASGDLCGLCREQGVAIAADALPVLEIMLRDPDAEVAEAAMYGFGYCGADALDVLLRLIEDHDPRMRERACDAIANAKMARQRARLPLLAALKDEVPQVRSRAAFALGLMRDTTTTTLDALAALAARDPVAEVRGSAVHALGNIGRARDAPRALAAHAATILAAFDDPDEAVRNYAPHALKGLKLPAGSLLSVMNARLLANPERGAQGMFGALLELNELEDLSPHLDALINLARQYPAVRPGVFRICRKYGRRAAALAPMIEQELAQEDCDVIGLAEALWAITGRADSAVPRLRLLLDADMHEALRAGKLLVSITGDGSLVVPMLERALECSPDEPAGFITEVGPPVAAVAPALARAIDENYDEPDWDVMWALTDAMAALQSPEPVAVTALCRSLSHRSGIVKGSALNGLKGAGPAARAALPVLRSLLDRGDREWMQAVRETIRAIEVRPN